MDGFPIPPSAAELIDKLWAAGFATHLVGGCVRDFLRGVPPHDFDLTTAATPDEMQAVFADYRTVPTGIRHGTLTVLASDIPYEITTYRVDGAYSDSRHPDSVSFTRSLREDLARRDFTVNAMAYNPAEGLTDPFGGQSDLDRQIIRAVGDPHCRFTEDALRILRALRFSSVLGFAIEPQTAQAARDLADRIATVSPERIREEMLRLLTGQNAGAVLLEYSDVLFFAVPALQMPLPAWENAVRAVLAVPEKERERRLSALLHPLGAEGAGKCLSFLRFDNATARRVKAAVSALSRPLPLTRREALLLLSECGEETALDRIALAEAMGDASAQTAEAIIGDLLRENACYRISSLAVNGTDLHSLGIPTGKELGAALSALLNAVIDGRVLNQKDALLAEACKWKEKTI